MPLWCVCVYMFVSDTIPVLVLSFQLLLLVVNCSSSIRVDDQQSNGPLVFTKWPPVKQYNKPPPSLRNQLMYHIRSHRRVPPGAMRKRFHSMPISSHSMPQQRVMRPMKMPMMPHYMSKGVMYQVYKPTMSTPQRINFQSSPPGPNTGEYVYENPFASMPMPPVLWNHLALHCTNMTSINTFCTFFFSIFFVSNFD